MIRRSLTVLLVSLSACGAPAKSGPPVRFAAAASDTVVVNSHHPTTLVLRALDARGSVVANAPIRYLWAGGDSVPITPSGSVTCLRTGDVVVRAIMGRAVRRLTIQCRPVEAVRLPGPLQFVLGDSVLSRPFVIPLAAYGADGRPIAPYDAQIFLKDSSIATLHGLALSPKLRGITGLGVHIGDRDAWIGIHVYQRVGTVAALDTLLRVPDRQRLFAVPLELKNGELLRQSIPPGEWMLTMFPESDTSRDRIRLRVEGAHCQDHLFNSARRWGCTGRQDATVVLYRPFGHAPTDSASAQYLLVRWLFPG